MAVAIANDLYLSLAASGSVFTHIQELSTAGASKVSVDVVLHQLSVASVTGLFVRVQGSNDRVNWSYLAFTGMDTWHVKLTAIDRGTKAGILIDGWAFVRAEYELNHTAGAKAILSSSLATGE